MNDRIFRKRVLITGLIASLVIVILIIRLFTLHFSSKIIVPPDNDFEPRRGFIKDRNGFILAMSIEVNSVFANPEEISNIEDTANILSALLKTDEGMILSRLKKKKRFVWLKRKVDDDTAKKISERKLSGIHIKKEYKRVYPHEKTASGIIGFVGIDNNGLDGIEYSQNDILSGKSSGSTELDGNDLYGGNVTLTLDRYIQQTADAEIEKAVTANKARQGAAIVLDVKTGKILALGKYPNYNPNEYDRYNQFARSAFTVINSFEPGSTLKIISLSSMLEHDPNVMTRSINCNGSVEIADAVINCTGVHGDLKMPDIIKYSCNVGVIKSASHIKKEHLNSTLKKFNFGIKVTNEFPGESDGILRSVDTWSGLSKYSMSIGHEFSVTSLQMAAAFGAIGNRGVYMTPALIESIERCDGRIVRSFFPKTKGRVISEDISNKLMDLMRGVVTNGTGKRAASKYYEIVGKTGTSQKYMKKTGAYSDRVISSFIGLAPYRNPEICILVVIDDPENKQSGGSIAAPVFAEITDSILPYMGVKGSYIKPIPPVKKIADDNIFDGKTIPDFRGKRLSESLRILIEIQKKFDITYSISGGGGRVNSQKPQAGEAIIPGVKINLNLKEKYEDNAE